MKTMEAPWNVYASVVVSTTAAVASPEKSVQSPGRGSSMPKNLPRWACFHQPATLKKAAILSIEARVETGKTASPGSGRSPSSPSDSALVSAL